MFKPLTSMLWLLIFGSQSFLFSTAGYSAVVSIRGEIKTQGTSAIISGDVLIQGWNVGQKFRCLSLRYNNPKYGWDHGEQRSLNRLSGSTSRIRYEGGKSEIAALDATKFETEDSKTHIIRITTPGDVHLSYWSSIPKPPSQSNNDWFVDGFYPQPLASCPRGDTQNLSFPGVSAQIDAQISYGKKFVIAGQNKVATSSSVSNKSFTSHFLGRSFAFAMSKSYKVHTFLAGKTEVSLFYHRRTLLNLEPTIKRSLEVMSQWAGPFPSPSLSIVETSDLARPNIPGIVAFNTPRQTVFSQAQSTKTGFLNWSHWMITKLLARQWYGSSIAPKSEDDQWIIAGNRDFLTLKALAKQPGIYNLFRNPQILSLNHLQLHEYSAASMNQKNPFAALTNNSLNSLIPAIEQHPMLSLRQAFALRQIGFQLTPGVLKRVFRRVTEEAANTDITPNDFIGSLEAAPELSKSTIRQLKSWWTKPGWPDFALAEFNFIERKDKTWTSEVVAEQLGEIDFAPIISLMEASGARHFKRAVKDKPGEEAKWTATFETKSKPKTASIDEKRESFDSNRFNNSNKAASIRLFPGSANSIADDGYTIFWLPYPQRRPGEPWAVVLQGALFKFINSSTYFGFEYAPAGHKTRSVLRYRYNMPHFGLHGDLQVDQNFDGDRIAESTLVRSPLFRGNPRVALNLGIRRKERVGQISSDHLTGAIGISAKPEGYSRTCSAKGSAEFEEAPESYAQGFSYQRSKGHGSLSCGKSRFGVGVRAFWGKLKYEGEPPQTAFFKPTSSSEAGLIVSQGGLAWASEIQTWGSNLLFPLYIPLPNDTLILSNRLRGNLFFQGGKATDPGASYEAGGVGLRLPFGGDISGSGTLSFTSLSAYLVLHSQVNQEKSDTPGVYVTLSGEL